MKHTRTLIFAFALTVMLPAHSIAKTSFDNTMSSILKEYLKIQDQLASDGNTGVVEAAKKISQLSKDLRVEEAPKEFRSQYKKVPKQVASSSGDLAKETDLKKQREVFKRLSPPIVNWVELAKPKGVGVYYCSMAPGAWVQKKGELRNPYYGASMLRCGIEVKQAKSGHDHAH